MGSNISSVLSARTGTPTTTDFPMAGNGSMDLTRPTGPRCPSTVPAETRMETACPTCRSTPTSSPPTGTTRTPPTYSITASGGTAPCLPGTGTRRAPCRSSRALAPTALTRIRWAISATTSLTTTMTVWSTPSTPTATVTPTARAMTTTATAPSTRTQTVGTPTATACPMDGRWPTASTRLPTPTWTAPTATPTATASPTSGSTSTRHGAPGTARPTRLPSTSGRDRST